MASVKRKAKNAFGFNMFFYAVWLGFFFFRIPRFSGLIFFLLIMHPTRPKAGHRQRRGMDKAG